MKKLFISLLAATALFTSCNNGGRTQLQESNDSLRTVLAEKDATITDLLGTMNIIEDGFKKINEMQGRINASSATSEVAYADALKSDIDAIVNTLANNKKEIEKLKQQVMGDKKVSKELKTKIANLENMLIEKSKELNAMVQALAEKDIHINRLDSIITGLTKENTGQELRLIEQEQQLNNVWYAIGTKSELKEQNILSSGEVMREKNVNFKYFTKAETSTNPSPKYEESLTSATESFGASKSTDLNTGASPSVIKGISKSDSCSSSSSRLKSKSAGTGKPSTTSFTTSGTSTFAVGNSAPDCCINNKFC